MDVNEYLPSWFSGDIGNNWCQEVWEDPIDAAGGIRYDVARSCVSSVCGFFP